MNYIAIFPISEYYTFCWDEEFYKSFELLKENMVTLPILVFPDWLKVFHVHVDAYGITLGAILAHPGARDIDHPITFGSMKISNAKCNY